MLEFISRGWGSGAQGGIHLPPRPGVVVAAVFLAVGLLNTIVGLFVARLASFFR